MAAAAPAERDDAAVASAAAALMPLVDVATTTVEETTEDVGGESAVNAGMFIALAAEETAAAMLASSAADALEDAFDINALTAAVRSASDCSVAAAARCRRARDDAGDGHRRSCKNTSSALAFVATAAADAAPSATDRAHGPSGESAVAPETLNALPDQEELNGAHDVADGDDGVKTPTALTKTSFVPRPRPALPMASRTARASVGQRSSGRVPRPTKDSLRSSAAKLAALGDGVADGVAAGVDDGEGLNDGVDVGDCVCVSEARLEGDPCVDTVADADAESLHAAEADGLMDADALPDFVRSSDGARVTADDRDGFGVRVKAVCVDVAVDESVDRKDRVGRLDDELDAEKVRMSGVAQPLADAEADGCAEREKLLLPETLADADDDGESRELIEIHDEALVLRVSRGELLTDADARGEPDGLGDAETDAVANGETDSDADGRADDDSTELPDADADEVTLGEVRGEREADAETDAEVVIVGEMEADAETDGEWVASGDADTERETEGECVTDVDADTERDSADEWDTECDAEDE